MQIVREPKQKTMITANTLKLPGFRRAKSSNNIYLRLYKAAQIVEDFPHFMHGGDDEEEKKIENQFHSKDKKEFKEEQQPRTELTEVTVTITRRKGIQCESQNLADRERSSSIRVRNRIVNGRAKANLTVSHQFVTRDGTQINKQIIRKVYERQIPELQAKQKIKSDQSKDTQKSTVPPYFTLNSNQSVFQREPAVTKRLFK